MIQLGEFARYYLLLQRYDRAPSYTATTERHHLLLLQ
jgi:hypothetical protein